MSCALCRALRQFGLNVGLMVDRATNTVLLGDPNETLSQRIARARAAGARWAAAICWSLTAISRALGHPGDHCDWSLDHASGSVGREILDLNPKR